MIVASLVSLLACKAAPTPEPVPTTPAVDLAPRIEEPELYAIPIAGDGRTFTIALAETEAGVVLFATEPAGIGRYALDLDARTSVGTEVIAIDRYTNLAAYDRAHDRLWWTTPLDQLRIPQPSRDGDFPLGDLVVTNSSTVEHSEGLRATVRTCPTPEITAGGRVPCDHELRTLLPAFGGVVLGGHFAERVGQTSAQPWIGFVDASGTLLAEHRLPDSGPAWIGALAQSDAGVLAVAWSGRGEPARASFLLFDGPTLDLLNTAPRTTPAWISSPWSAAVPAPDGGFWVALTTFRHELTIVSLASDGSITAEHAIEGAELPISSVQSFGLRDGEPWLLIARQYAEPSLWAGRIDAASGAVPEHHVIPLPRELVPERLLAVDDGLLLAGRENLERPLAVWIPLGKRK